jgi:hypothetical protein
MYNAVAFVSALLACRTVQCCVFTALNSMLIVLPAQNIVVKFELQQCLQCSALEAASSICDPMPLQW